MIESLNLVRSGKHGSPLKRPFLNFVPSTKSMVECPYASENKKQNKTKNLKYKLSVPGENGLPNPGISRRRKTQQSLEI